MPNVFTSRLIGGAMLCTATLASSASAQFVITPLYLRGDPAPGTGATYETFDRPILGSSGNVLHVGDTNAATTADDFVMVGNTLIAQEGAAAPGTGAGTFGIFDIIQSGGQINSSDHVIFLGGINGVPTTANRGMWSNASGALALVAQEGQPAAGIAGRTYLDFDFPGVFDSGNNGFVAVLDASSTTTDSVIYRNGAVAHREGSQAPFRPAGVNYDANFAEAEWAPDGTLLFVGNTNDPAGGDQYLVRDIGGVSTVVAQEGQAIAANAGADFLELFLQISIADNGRWGMRGNLGVAPSTSDAFVMTEGGFYKQEGEAVPELPGVNVGNFNGIDINSNGDVILLADLIGAADPNIDEGLFFNDQLIITDGVQAPGLPAGTLLSEIDFEELSINDSGNMIFVASYTGTVVGQGIFSIAVPEPASVSALLAIGGLALRRVRRRA
jgi:hypothetical protein